MKIAKYLTFVIISLFLIACPWGDPYEPYEYEEELPVDIPLKRTFLKNTLTYTVYVESYFLALTNKNNISGNKLVNKYTTPYSAPVEIKPGEIKLIMDYVEPDNIKIYVKQQLAAGEARLENIYSLFSYSDYFPLQSIFAPVNASPNTENEIYTWSTSKMSVEDLALIPALDEEKYKFENLPWDTFSIGETYVFEDGEKKGDIYNDDIYINSLENRKKSLTDTKVYDYFLHLNPNNSYGYFK